LSLLIGEGVIDIVNGKIEIIDEITVRKMRKKWPEIERALSERGL